MKRSHRSVPAGPTGGRETWPVVALLVAGGWLVVSPLVLPSLWEFGDGHRAGQEQTSGERR